MKKQGKSSRKEAREIKRKDKLAMYDMIIANLIAGKELIEPSKELKSSEIAIGFSNIASSTQISKYFVMTNLPDYLQNRIIDVIRRRCLREGVKINFYFYSNPYKISWDSAEMRNKLTMWRQFANENSGGVNVFDYRNKRNTQLARDRIIASTRYFNEAELNYKRTLMRVAFMIEVSTARQEEYLINMIESIRDLKEVCSTNEIKLRELRVNMIDWLQFLSPFSLKQTKEVDAKVSRKIISDDILANFTSLKQGRVGHEGLCLGIDVLSGAPVMYKFKKDPDAAENWLISAESGGGKSLFVKALITYLLADDFVVTVMDYEGDEYDELAAYIKAGNSEDVKIISMGKGSSKYFDPVEIPPLTGDYDVDVDLKENCIRYILATYRTIVGGLDRELTNWEERVVSLAIQKVYSSAGVTEDRATWHRSKGLRLLNVYEEIKYMVESRELMDDGTDNEKHKAASKILEAASVYFEPGEAKSSMFKNPLPAESLYSAKLIIFTFGMKGAGNNTSDPVVLALKQLSVACVATQVSNHCKYIKRCFNAKVWEEYQRWGDAKGSAEIISDAMTGGRKRGDVNILITNDLGALMDDSNAVSKKIRQNIQNRAIGKIRDKSVREDFCRGSDLMECLPALEKIAKAHTLDDDNGSYGGRYKYSFCVMLANGKRAIVKVRMPEALMKTGLFRTGIRQKEEGK